MYVAISLLAIVVVPLTMAILSAVFPADARIAAAAIARVVLVSVLLPLAAGMLVRRLAPGFAERASPVLSKVAGLLLLAAFLPIVIVAWPAVRELLGNGTALVMAAVVGTGLLAGHLLGGPDPDDRTALAVASATRHPGMALLIAKANFASEPVAPALMLFLLVAIVVTIPYQVWTKKRAAARVLVPEGRA